MSASCSRRPRGGTWSARSGAVVDSARGGAALRPRHARDPAGIVDRGRRVHARAQLPGADAARRARPAGRRRRDVRLPDGAGGVGSLVSALSLAFGSRPTLGRVLLGARGSVGLAVAGRRLSSARCRSACVLMVIVGWGPSPWPRPRNTIIQLTVPDELRGRVMSVYTTVFAGSTPIGSLVTGGLASSIGVAATLLAGGHRHRSWSPSERRSGRRDRRTCRCRLACPPMATPIRPAAHRTRAASDRLRGCPGRRAVVRPGASGSAGSACAGRPSRWRS